MFDIKILLTDDSKTDLDAVCEEIVNQNGLKNLLIRYDFDDDTIILTLNR